LVSDTETKLSQERTGATGPPLFAIALAGAADDEAAVLVVALVVPATPTAVVTAPVIAASVIAAAATRRRRLGEPRLRNDIAPPFPEIVVFA
jgi:hypothetical protein